MNGRHRGLAALVSILAIISLILTYHSQTAQAQQSATVRITKFQVQTIDGKEAPAPLMAGSSYRISFTLAVAKGVSDTVILDTDFKMVGNKYWDLPEKYPGINLQTVNPARKQISFRSDEGNPEFVLTGQIPEDVVAVKLPTGQFLHLKKPVLLLTLKTASGSINDERKMDAIDKSIETYQATLVAKRKVVEGSSGEASFVGLIGALVKEAQALAAKGDTDGGAALLKAIPDRGWPQPPASNMMMYAIIGVVAIMALIFLVLMIKSRGTASYSRGVIEDQVKRLDVVSVKAGRLGDKVLLQEINSVKEELDRISR